MKDPFDLIFWAIGIGLAWMILITLTGLDDWQKMLIGKRRTTVALEAKIEALEKRVTDLEKRP